MERCFEEMLVDLCAPTLCGVKPGSLFRYCPDNGATARAVLERWNHIFAPLGLSLRILKECPKTGSLLIFVFRGKWLGRILRDEKVKRFLKGEGYNTETSVDVYWNSSQNGSVWNLIFLMK